MPGPYAFKQIFAADPSNTSNVAKGGSVLLFAVGDASRKPLVLTDLANGMVLPNPVPINSNGFGPAFLHETLPQVAWEGGGFSGTFESFEGMRADAVAAMEASQESAQAAGDARVAAEAAAGNAATGAAGALAGAVEDAKEAKVAAQAAAKLVGAPAGDAVLAAIQPGGAAHGELSGTIGAQVAPKLDKVEAAATYALKSEAGGGPSLPPLSRVAESTKRGFRVGMVGTSIANNTNSALRTMVEHMKTLFGDSNIMRLRAGNIGGSPSNAYLGWSKQPFGGLGFVRMRGSSTSTPQKYYAYGDQVVVEWSQEADAGPTPVLIDGVSVGTFGGPGAQSYGNRTVFTTTPGAHEITIGVPTSGYSYFEAVEVRSASRTGVEVIDGTLGGASVRDMTNLRATVGAQVAGIPIAVNVGLNAFSARTDLDLLLFEFTVNDAGAGLAWASGGYQANMETIVANTARTNTPIVVVIEMGGHYSMPNDGGNSNANNSFNAIRNYLLTLRKYNHVTVIDWHGATIMDDLEAYGLRYYSVASVNVPAGTFVPTSGGDFIHPNKMGLQVLENQLANAFSISPPKRELPTQIATDRMRTLPVGAGVDKSVMIAGIATRFPVPSGPTLLAIGGGASTGYQGKIAPYYRQAGAFNQAASTMTAIAASGTSDQHGKYVTLAGSGVGLGSTIPWASGELAMVTIRASGPVAIRADGDVTFYVDGVPMPKNYPTDGRTILHYPLAAGTAPLTFSVQVGSLTASKNIFLSGNIYEIGITRSDAPLLAG